MRVCEGEGEGEGEGSTFGERLARFQANGRAGMDELPPEEEACAMGGMRQEAVSAVGERRTGTGQRGGRKKKVTGIVPGARFFFFLVLQTPCDGVL